MTEFPRRISTFRISENERTSHTVVLRKQDTYSTIMSSGFSLSKTGFSLSKTKVLWKTNK